MSRLASGSRSVCVIRALFFVGLAAGCAGTPPGLQLDRVDEARIAGIQEAPIVLEDGQWEGDPFVEGGAARPRVGLVEEFVVEGAFTAPGREEAAVLLWSNEGGSGTRVWLCVLEAGPERPRSVATTLVGDRVQVIDLAAGGRELRLELVAHGPGDAACCPNQHELRRYRFVDREVVEETEVLGPVTLDLLRGHTWRLRRLSSGSEEPVEVEATLRFDGEGRASGNAGCNLYEATVETGENKDLRIDPRITTMRRCPEDMTGTEDAFLARLRGVTRYSFLNGRLALQYQLGEEHSVMTLEPVPDAANP